MVGRRKNDEEEGNGVLVIAPERHAGVQTGQGDGDLRQSLDLAVWNRKALTHRCRTEGLPFDQRFDDLVDFEAESEGAN